jgi:hypothetical protein
MQSPAIFAGRQFLMMASRLCQDILPRFVGQEIKLFGNLALSIEMGFDEITGSQQYRCRKNQSENRNYRQPDNHHPQTKEINKVMPIPNFDNLS